MTTSLTDPRRSEPTTTHPGWISGQGTTFVLIGVVTTLVVVLLAELAVGLRHQLRDPAAAPAPPDGEIRVLDDVPVAMSEPAVQEGVDAAAKAARRIVTIDYARFAQDVEAAEALMTPSFAQEYRRTVDAVRAAYQRRKVVVQAFVVGRGVVRANDTELQALVVLDQRVTERVGEKSRTTASQDRALVTVVHTDRGWLVDGLLTK